MRDLIDRDALIAEYDRVHVGEPGGARKLMEDAPTVQPEIIRCRDCKHWDRTWSNDWSPDYHYCPVIDEVRKDDFHCRYAERRTDEQID